MTDSTSYNIDAEAWRRALLAIKRDILDAEPVAALNRIDVLLDALENSRQRSFADSIPPGF